MYLRSAGAIRCMIKSMMVYLASDHAGFALKEKIKAFLIDAGYAVKDFGAFAYEAEDDYPDFVAKAAEAVEENSGEDRAVVFGGSGQGEAMVANRYKGVRAVVYYGGPKEIVKLSREHNNANVLSIGARFVKEDEALAAVKLWLETPFSGEEQH